MESAIETVQRVALHSFGVCPKIELHCTADVRFVQVCPDARTWAALFWSLPTGSKPQCKLGNMQKPRACGPPSSRETTMLEDESVLPVCQEGLGAAAAGLRVSSSVIPRTCSKCFPGLYRTAQSGPFGLGMLSNVVDSNLANRLRWLHGELPSEQLVAPTVVRGCTTAASA